MTAIAACRTCGTEPLEKARFWHGCGSPVQNSDTRAEYKQVTVLFADVVHSMDIAATVGAERLREIMADLADRCAAVVQRYGGTVDKFDSIVDAAREAADTIAERMRALDALPDGRSDTVVATTTVPAVPPGELSTTETVDISPLGSTPSWTMFAPCMTRSMPPIRQPLTCCTPSSTTWKRKRGCSNPKTAKPEPVCRLGDERALSGAELWRTNMEDPP